LVSIILFLSNASAQYFPNDGGIRNRQQWGLHNDANIGDINAPEAWDLFKGSSSVKIWITDSGVLIDPVTDRFNIASSHPDLIGRVVLRTNWRDAGGHGTGVAGIIGAVTNNNYGIAGIDHACLIYQDVGGPASLIAASDNNADVINMSWVWEPTAELINSVAHAYNNNSLLVACMYNGDPGTGNIYYPAALKGVMAVGATDKFGQRSSFSNYGDHISVVAPGGSQLGDLENENIYTTSVIYKVERVTKTEGYDEIKTYTPTFRWLGGTSFSAPFVTGLASLVKGYALSKGISLDNDDIRKIIELSSSNGYWADRYTGFGRINARKALDYLNAPWQINKNSTTTSVIVSSESYSAVVPGLGFIYGTGQGSLVGVRQKLNAKIPLTRYYTTTPRVWTRGAQSKGWTNDPAMSGIKNDCESVSLYKNADNVWICETQNYIYYNILNNSWYPCVKEQARFSCTALGVPQPPQMAGVSLRQATTTKAVPGTNYNLWFNWAYAYGCPTLERYEVQYYTDAVPGWRILKSDVSPNATGWTIYDFGSVTSRIYLQMRAIHNDGYVTPWSNTIYIDPPNQDDPIVAESNTAEGTAFSNGKKIVVDTDGKLHTVYVSGETVYYTSSLDEGETWVAPVAVGSGKHPAIELTTDNQPTVCWNNGNCLYSIKMTNGVFEEPQLIYTGPEGSEISYLSYVLDQNSNNSYLGWVDEGASGSSVLISTYNPSTSGTLAPTPIDQGGTTAFKSPSLALDKAGNLKIAWSHTGKVYYKDGNEFVEMGDNGIHPIVDTYGDKTTVVWQEEIAPDIYQIVKKTKGVNGWSDKQIISCPDGQNADFPVVVAGGQYVYSKNVKDSDYDLIYNCEYDNGWLMGTQNLSGAQGGISRYPSIAFKQEWPKSKLYVLWTEEMPTVKTGSKAIASYIKSYTMTVDPVPSNYIDVGTEEYNSYNIQKKGTYYYGPQPEYTIDYHSSELKYSIQNLDPAKKYRIKVVYYQETDANIKQTLTVDKTFNNKTTIKPKTVVTEEHWLPAVCVKDGQIEISIAKNAGEYAVCSVIALYEYDRDCDGKSTEDISGSNSKSTAAYSYELMQNYPNPNTGKTAIKYQLAQSGKVSLKIYNTLGQVVKTLVSQEQPAGIYNAIWDGRDNTGKAAANGVYFYRLESGSFKATRKMVVLK
ncbi:MAG: S8 family serine peptidase, partial [Candidatus Edwardsbacteria bacterium]|nr:S8 family serine peptidase [Candidatus Edwardsbacteria bacterium]MBU1576832.1 S8 family serine peptidase [Candidatus Edwardsbacteria bacterium]MBU2463923.1 S8 family serine peptidase [Candidatus Edwardsbacteria bacterium]